ALSNAASLAHASAGLNRSGDTSRQPIAELDDRLPNHVLHRHAAHPLALARPELELSGHEHPVESWSRSDPAGAPGHLVGSGLELLERREEIGANHDERHALMPQNPAAM